MNKPSKYQCIVCTLLVILNFAVIFSYYNWGKTSEDITSYRNQIELLKAQNDSLNFVSSQLTHKVDSLRGEIKDVDSVIVKVNNWYEKELVDITNQPIASDVMFFTDYLSKVDSGFVDSDNPVAIKKDKSDLPRAQEIQPRDSSSANKDKTTGRFKQ